MRPQLAASDPAVSRSDESLLRLVRSPTAASELSLQGVTKRWGSRGPAVLRGLDLELAGGTSVAITGRNGAGKTTLLRVAAGLIAPDAGTVVADGLDPERDRREYSRRLGLLSAASAGLYARLSVRRHIDLAARMALIAPHARGARVRATLERFELAALAGRRVDRLSMGQRQRVRLAMTFVHEPRLLLLDEPGNSLDEEGLSLLARAIARTLERGGAAIWVGPRGVIRDIPFDHAYVLRDGSLTNEGEDGR